MPEDYEDKLIDFQRYIIKQRVRHDFSLDQIGNADQTPMTFDLPASTTVNVKGASSVSIRTTGNEKNRFTVMLACTADGGKLPPFVVFKRKTLPKGATWPKGIVVRCQHNGWMDDALMRDWVKTVWGKRPGGLRKKSLLVLDAFRCHKSDDVKEVLDDMKTTLAIIPGGMTSVLQPLDVSVNKPMKVIMQRKWNDWYAGDNHTFTNTGRMRKPELGDICQWIVDAWAELDPSIIVRAFLKCSISNKLDRTDDDALWCDQLPDATGEDDSDDYYSEIPTGMSTADFDKLFESSSEDEFEGFEERDIL